MSLLSQELIKLGLSDKEAKVYLASLELGYDTVLNIAKKAGINRPTAYFILESLQKKGIVTTFEKDKKTYFASESPDKLVTLLNQQKEDLNQKQKEFENILPEFKALFNLPTEKPTVRFFEGRQGLLSMREDFLKTTDKKIEAMYCLDDLNKVFTPEENAKFTDRRAEKNIETFAIYTSINGPTKRPKAPGERRFIPFDKFPVTADITIYNNKVAIASLKGKLSGVIIENKEIANTVRSLFYLGWESAKKV
ncbi:MAG: helix-turn-helix domain-containing protein [Patescibacteria group bacterium]|jgi:sugar-specific transcriptional regulator TrmB